MEDKKIAEELFGILNTMSETQTRQTTVIDKLSDGLLRATDIINVMQTQIKNLENRIEILEKGAKE